MVDYPGLSVPQATAIQNDLCSRLDTAEQAFALHTIAGADISLNLYSTTVYAGIVLLSFPQLKPIAYSLVKAETTFPYVPGFLAFREVPALLQAWEALPQKPDVLVVDGHGIAHPRRMGIAAHFGVLTGQRSMGCAKKLLYGKFADPAPEQGASTAIIAKGQPIGYTFRSKANTAPVFVSPGHKMGLNNCLQTIRQCVGRYRIPEPTRLAHETVNRFRVGELAEGYQALR